MSLKIEQSPCLTTSQKDQKLFNYLDNYTKLLFFIYNQVLDQSHKKNHPFLFVNATVNLTYCEPSFKSVEINRLYFIHPLARCWQRLCM